MTNKVLPETIAGLPTRAPSLGPTRNFHLDAMRGLAAILVVWNHLRLAFFVPYPDAGHGLLVPFIYVDHFVARAAVLFFFVLSGYLVGTSVLRAEERNKWSWPNYLLSRLSRLWTVLIPALLLTAAFDAFGKWNSISAPTYYSEYPFNAPLAPLDTWSSFLGTTFFAQNILTAVYGTLGPAWSLANEFWYYILFPLAVFCILPGDRLRRVLYGLLFVSLAVYTGADHFLLFGTWLFGIVAGHLGERYPIHLALRRRVFFLLSLALMIGTVVMQAAHLPLPEIGADYLLAAASIGLVWCALSSPPAGGLYAKVALVLSEISYTLYLIHQPMLTLLSAFWLRLHRWPADVGHLLLAIVPMGISLLFAWGMYFLFESRTDNVRAYFKRHLLDRF